MTHRVSFTEKELATIQVALVYFQEEHSGVTTEMENLELTELIDKVHEFTF